MASPSSGPLRTPRIYNPLTSKRPAESSSDSSEQRGGGKGSNGLTLTILREELRLALDRHADHVTERIRRELGAKVMMPEDEGDLKVSHWVLPQVDEGEDSEEVDDKPRLARQTRHDWLLRNPTYMNRGASFLDMDVADSGASTRVMKTYSGPKRLTPKPGVRNHKSSRHHTSGRPTTNTVRFSMPFTAEGQRMTMGRTDSGPRETSREAFTFMPGEVSDDEPADEVPQKSQARHSAVCCSSEYFEDLDYMNNPIAVTEYPRYRLTLWCLKQTLHSIVENSWFEYACGAFVVLNAISLGFETNFQVTHSVNHVPRIFSILEALFCVLFTLEQVMRLAVYRRRFLTMKGWSWNLFDLIVVGLQLFEQVSHFFTSLQVDVDVSLIRMLRVLRLIRITRLIRVLRMVHELRTLVASIMGSFKSLGWTMLLLMIVVYTFSVLFTQIILDTLPNNPPNARIFQKWFGSLARTALTLFESVMGGISWEEVLHPMVIDIGPWVAVLFCFYVAFCVFALMNVVTGEFVEKAMQTAQDHKDMYLANRISEVFFAGTETGSDHITWEVFAKKMEAPDMREYFKAINVDPSEAFGLFRLLDTDGSGDVDCEEIVNGLLRLRGSARALELSLLTSETNRIHQALTKNFEDFERRLIAITRLVAKVRVDRTTEAGQVNGDAVTRMSTNPGWG